MSAADTLSADRSPPVLHGSSAPPGKLTEPAESPPLPPSAAAADSPAKKKQKRNKPTLSCEECVDRKTKCDRGRPTCLACVKRQSACKYSEVANLIASAEYARSIPALHRPTVSMEGADEARRGLIPGPELTKADSRCGAPRPTSKPKKQSKTPYIALGKLTVPSEVGTPRPAYRSSSISSSSSSGLLLSNVPHTKHAPSSIFGLGSGHPFANYWTTNGGLPEVIGVMPSKEQADILVGAYFECVDPVYPMINRAQFYAEYENFWSLPLTDKCAAEPVFLALQFVMYAMGLQFLTTPSEQERAQMAEFYNSAAHQALRISSYLSRSSVKSMQAMVLIGYFLMNDNHAPDAWAFGGVLVRQAYAMGLNRDPDVIAPRITPAEKTQRRKVWQAVLFQDTFLTVLLKLPPTTTFSDVAVESLTDDLNDTASNGSGQSGHEAIINPMSISSIAPTPNPHPPYELADRQYIRSMWHMANLVQDSVCRPRSLHRPLTGSKMEKSNLLNAFRNLFASFPAALTTSDHAAMQHLAQTNPRITRQNLFLRSNFWHCFMIIQADENEMGGVKCDVKGALEAARMAVEAFFHLWEFLRRDAGVWWVFQHRAFEEALTMARILAAQTEPLEPHKHGTSVRAEPLFALARNDIKKMLDILEQVGNSCPEMQKTRTEVLRAAFEEIPW